MRSPTPPGRWLIAPALLLAFCSRGNAPSVVGPSATPPTAAAADGMASASATGDVKVGAGALEFLNLAIWGFKGDPGAGGFVSPGGTYGLTPGLAVRLWATYPVGSPENPRFKVEWGDGTVNAAGCGACSATHTYAGPGLYTVKATLDDRVSSMVTRTFQLDARPTPTPTPSPTPSPSPTPTPSPSPTVTPTPTPSPTPAAASCLDILTKAPGTADGVYSIDPLANGPVSVFCDMTRDGGGWTRAVNIRGDSVLHADQAAAVGDVSDPVAAAKLSDAMINALNTQGYWRYNCGSSKEAYVRNASNQWTSSRINSENWSMDNNKDGVFECAANRTGYVFSDFPACSAGHSNYAAAGGAGEGNGCFHGSWGLNGNLWVR